MSKPMSISIQGIVIPDVWDEMGNVVSVSIFTYEEEKIRVVDDTEGRPLKDFLRMRVSVVGVMTSQDRAPAIRVHRYHIDSGQSPPEK